MHRLNELLHILVIPGETLQRADALCQAIGVVEAAMTAPDISRARAEHTLHRLTADMFATKRGAMH